MTQLSNRLETVPQKSEQSAARLDNDRYQQARDGAKRVSDNAAEVTDAAQRNLPSARSFVAMLTSILHRAKPKSKRATPRR